MKCLNNLNILELNKIWLFLIVLTIFKNNCQSQFLEVFSEGDEEDSSEEDYDIGDLDLENIAEDATLFVVK